METKTSWVLKNPIAHRGLHNFEFPENSLPAFENAVAHGFAVELDVRIIDDHTIIVFHDDKLSRGPCGNQARQNGFRHSHIRTRARNDKRQSAHSHRNQKSGAIVRLGRKAYGHAQNIQRRVRGRIVPPVLFAIFL